ncbi:MAG TPA: biotin--[acetyl-CoA-carboxylase] ligase [Steroidobacteraceae bacterium]|jgi:BirA family biotin operon repressor/biotin-[acetyl-CoA-carboxylase] ligase|nr:biotin--[acetyl-CoA-carboxylase] ligase [Steroidobacteraceae bacterium]
MSEGPLARALYALLSDAQFHSGTALAQRCRVSRSAIWKAVSRLRTLGVVVDAVPNRGYRIPAGTALLDASRILALLPAAERGRLHEGSCVWMTSSTNADLLQRTGLSPGQFDFRTAEYQSAGRGRRTRRWFAPPGGALCLSMSWSFVSLPAHVAALSLAVGVCVLRALRNIGRAGSALKWPNDIVLDGRKLGGILIELRAEGSGPALVVIGIGLNVALGSRLLAQVRASGTEAADLSALGGGPCDRNQLAAALLTACVSGLARFEQDGFHSFMAEWRAADALAGKEVLVSGQGAAIAGHARGIDVDGALCVQTREGLQRFVTGEVSVRAAA